MSTHVASGGTAVMARRVEPPGSLDYFPTPPWATRALLNHVLAQTPIFRNELHSCWEPAAGEGHMAEVLREYFTHVHATDVHDYGKRYGVGSFVGEGLDVASYSPCADCAREHAAPDWVITNPPFNLAVEFAERALREAKVGVALLVRTAWAEGAERFARLFRTTPPATIAFFVERVPMTKGRWDPNASSATSYTWFVWRQEALRLGLKTTAMWIPPGQRKALERPLDRKRFAEAAQ
jgi:hypothetical protein